MKRYYLVKLSKGEDFGYDEKEMQNVRQVFSMLINIDSFVNQNMTKEKQTKEIEDKWIISRFNGLIKEMTKCYNEHKYFDVLPKFENFVLNDLSRTYIKIIRDRSAEVYEVLEHIRTGLAKLIAPVTPFLSEAIWQEMNKKGIVNEESIHLSEWPKADEKKIDLELEKNFESALKIIELGMAKRDEVKIGLRWPLASAKINCSEKLGEELEKIIARQLNVKKVEIKKGKELSLELDTKITP